MKALLLTFLLSIPPSLGEDAAATASFADNGFLDGVELINPLFPASGPATGSYNGIHRESNFLAAPLPGSPGEKQ
jgi:hypothetical protein